MTSAATGFILLGINVILQGQRCRLFLLLPWAFWGFFWGKPFIPFQGFSTALLCYLYKFYIRLPCNHSWEAGGGTWGQNLQPPQWMETFPLRGETRKPPVEIEIHILKAVLALRYCAIQLGAYALCPSPLNISEEPTAVKVPFLSDDDLLLLEWGWYKSNEK